MRICMIQGVVPLHTAGGGPSLGWNSARNLVARGHDVTLLTTSTRELRGRRQVDGLNVVFLEDAEFGWGYAVRQRFVRVALEDYVRAAADTFDVLQVRGWLDSGFAGLACRSDPLPVPVLGYTHGLGLVHKLLTPLRLMRHDKSKPGHSRMKGQVRLIRRYVRQYYPVERAVRYLDGFSAVSHHALKWARWLYQIPESRLFLIHDGISTTQFVPPEEEPARKTVLYVGGLDALKGTHILVAAIPRVLKSVPDARFRLVGDGPQADELRETVERLHLRDQVTFLGQRESDGVAAEMRACQVVVNPSLHRGGYETVQIEAMACGRIVVSPDAGSNRSLITPGKTGLMFRQGRPRSLADALVKALTLAPNAKTAIGEAARERAITDFSVEEMGRMNETPLMSINERYRKEIS